MVRLTHADAITPLFCCIVLGLLLRSGIETVVIDDQWRLRGQALGVFAPHQGQK